MQIIHIVPGKANPNTINGVNKVVDAIATEQMRLGYDTMVVGVADNTVKRHKPLYNYILFTKSKLPFCYPKAMLQLLLENSTEETVFHFHSVFVFWFLPLIKALKRNGRRHIFLTPHGQYIDEAMRPLKKRIMFSLLDANVIREVEAVHAIGCRTEVNSLLKDNAKRIVAVPNGFGSIDIPKLERGKDLVFGYLGRLECRQKGLDILIPAFINYRRSGGKGTLRIAGTGSDEAKLRKMVMDADMENAVLFDGVLYDEKKWQFLYHCSAFVQPSRWEGIPTACLEALSAGCPLLITENTNLGDYVKKYNAGSCITTLSEENLQNQLMNFELCYSDWLQYSTESNNARRIIEEELNWKNITEKIIKELYLR